jgi:hypothetical protein
LVSNKVWVGGDREGKGKREEENKAFLVPLGGICLCSVGPKVETEHLAISRIEYLPSGWCFE